VKIRVDDRRVDRGVRGFRIATPSSPATSAAAVTGLKATALGEITVIGTEFTKPGVTMLITLASGAGDVSST
jgi:hypothetical protein